jgi:hypothetical protein
MQAERKQKWKLNTVSVQESFLLVEPDLAFITKGSTVVHKAYYELKAADCEET